MNRLKGLKLKFDVTDNPELSAAIIARCFDLGGAHMHPEVFTQFPIVAIGSLKDGEVTAGFSEPTDSNWATLDDLYHLPEQKARLILPDGKDIELSDETFANLKQALTD